MDERTALQKMVRESRRVVFFGGAGMSTESGIPDFRSEDGLYRQQFRYPPETMLSIDFYRAHPEEFYDFYRKKMICLDAQPNAGHYKLAELERAGKLSAVVTQNIDGLHQQAGNKRVYELHGSVHRNLCRKCGRIYDARFILNSEGLPRCACGGLLKPDVVLYGEPLDEKTVEGSIAAIREADLLVIGGTSLAVWPAAGLIDYYRGKRLVLINRTETPADGRADLVLRASIGQVLGALRVEEGGEA
ncbi:MAG: NAD-dependent protein deacylase [Provencibacterium sp.]|jgi:NAD-dependent deacetylase|nr:NAD-dependent protein deacylase [Provencibacterium sp.]